jgi:hypothetical protein
MGGFATPAGGGKSPLENLFGQLGKLFPDAPPTSPVGYTNPATGNTWADDLMSGNAAM